MEISPDQLLLQRAYHWAKIQGSERWMTQPLGGDRVRTYTWTEAIDEARRMAAHLQTLGFEPGSRIAILSKNCANFIQSDLAIWMAGFASVAIYPTLNAETVRYILEHSDSKLLFVGKLDTWNDMKPGVPEGLPCISYSLSPPNDFPTWEDIVKRTKPVEGNPVRAADDTAILVYTSGSTGRPKGVEHTFRTMSATCVGFGDTIGWRPGERALSDLPLAHVFERAAIEAASIYNGFEIFFAESLDTFVQDLQRCRPTVFHSVPRLWQKFQQGVFKKMPPQKLRRLLKIPIVSGIVKRKILNGLGLGSVRLAISGSAPISPELIQWYRDLGLELLEGYAMTENFCYSHFSLPGRSRVGYVGNAMTGVDVKLGPDGEVLVKSPASMKGYYREPELTAAAFTDDGHLRTGDRGELDSEGRLKITGRVKELFKTSKGKYVAPVPIENLLNVDTRLELSCVAGADQGQPFALVQLAEDLRKQVASAEVRAEVQRALEQLRTSVNARIDPHEHLEFLVVVKDAWSIENGYLTPTMKIKRSVLEERSAPKVAGWYASKQAVVWET